MSEKGLIQVYTGPGKGKTTAALGLISRALGHGHQVLLVRLLKPVEPRSGEVLFLTDQPGVRIVEAGVGVIHGRATSEEVRASLLDALSRAEQAWQDRPVDLLVLDEINNALHRKAISVEELWGFLERRPEATEVVLTGRNAPEELIARADLVTSMENLRHPLANGVTARSGIEF
jgi:cob(I)alamin adenosyltransferase